MIHRLTADADTVSPLSFGAVAVLGQRRPLTTPADRRQVPRTVDIVGLPSNTLFQPSSVADSLDPTHPVLPIAWTVTTDWLGMSAARPVRFAREAVVYDASDMTCVHNCGELDAAAAAAQLSDDTGWVGVCWSGACDDQSQVREMIADVVAAQGMFGPGTEFADSFVQQQAKGWCAY